MDIRIAARKSDLARLQAYLVGDVLGTTGHNVQFHFRQSLGDINQDDPLWKMPEKGVFTEDFRQGLIDGKWDMVVHSWKDLPIEIGRGTEIVATLPREDSRDLFLFKTKSMEDVKISSHLKVFSSSPRRMHNLTPFFKDHFPGQLSKVEFRDVRGNINTRMSKLMESDEVHGLVVAKAALDRLLSSTRKEFEASRQEIKKYLQDCRWQILPLKANPTAAAQGALAIEIATGRDDLRKILTEINCLKTWKTVQEERKILKSHGGGCHQKIGVSRLKRSYGEIEILRGETEAGEKLGGIKLVGAQLRLEKPASEKINFFTRQSRPYVRETRWQAHFIARANALPESETFSAEELVWASGIETWRKLAERGVWVSGCSESLGEDENLWLEHLVPSDLTWVKWSHASSSQEGEWPVISTYELLPAQPQVGWDQYEEYYWMSGTQFLRALELNPDIIKAHHFCGPGKTFALISKVLKEKGISRPPQPLPSRQIWLDAIEESKS